MSKTKNIYYINRYRLPQYNSIEELFCSISQKIAQEYEVKWVELSRFGASPLSLLKNLLSVKPKKNIIYHITGDVNYMALRLGNQSILTVHDVKSAIQGTTVKQLIIKWLWFKWPARRVKYITVISQFSKTELEQLIPKQAHKIKVIYNPVNTKITPDLNFKFNDKTPTVLLVGTKSNKNLEGSLEALKDLQVKLIIIGALRPNQLQLLQESGLEYTNQKQLSFDEIITCYKQADILCFPSFYEGFGIPIIEAQAMGRPVVTSNFGAMLEVAQDAACLVNPYNTESIKNGIEKIIREPVYRKQLIQKGFENIKRFQLETIASQYMELYKELDIL